MVRMVNCLLRRSKPNQFSLSFFLCQLADQLNIERVGIPKNFTHIASPLDLSSYILMKAFEQAELSTLYSAALSKIIADNPDYMDIAEC